MVKSGRRAGRTRTSLRIVSCGGRAWSESRVESARWDRVGCPRSERATNDGCEQSLAVLGTVLRAEVVCNLEPVLGSWHRSPGSVPGSGVAKRGKHTRLSTPRDAGPGVATAHLAAAHRASTRAPLRSSANNDKQAHAQQAQAKQSSSKAKLKQSKAQATQSSSHAKPKPRKAQAELRARSDPGRTRRTAD